MSIKDLLPFIVAVITTVFAFFLNQLWLQHRDKKNRYEKILTLLDVAKAEIDSHCGKLVIMRRQFAECLGQIDKGESNLSDFPSYNLLPGFLESLKTHFIEFTETALLVPEVGSLCFELHHIQNKTTLILDAVETIMRSPLSPNDYTIRFMAIHKNMQSIHGLIAKNIAPCKDLSTKITTLHETISKEHKEFLTNSPFQSLLKG